MPGGNRRQKRKNWRRRFSSSGYRYTFPRKAILEVLTRSVKHLSAEDVYHKVHRDFPRIGLTTVYRTLELLTDMKIIHKFDFGDGRSRYEFADEGESDHHHHLICTECKRVIDYSDFMEEELMFIKHAEKGLSKKFHFKINDHMIQFLGVCDRCRK
jgi:Fur family ferric uptake transcriptional regulator